MKTRPQILLFAFIILLLAGFQPQPALGEKILVHETTEEGDYAGDPKICVSANNLIYLVWYGNLNGICFSRSLDNGRTFETMRELYGQQTDGRFIKEPEISLGADGKIYVFFYTIGDSENPEYNRIFTIYMCTSTDEGETFETSIVYSEEYSGGDTDFTSGMTNHTNLMVKGHCIYYLYGSNIARSMDGGASFEMMKYTIGIEEHPQNVFGGAPSMAVDSDNTIYVIWYQGIYDPDNDVDEPLCDLYFTQCKSSQSAFEEPRMIAECASHKDNILNPNLLCSSTGELHLFWKKYPSESWLDDDNDDSSLPLYYMVSSDGGESFTQYREITLGEDTSKYSVIIFPKMDATDVIHFLYQYRGDLYYTKSSDRLTSFSPNNIISKNDYDEDLFPVSENEVHMVWTEAPISGTVKIKIYFTNSSLGLGESASSDDDSDDANGADTSGGDGGGGGGGGCFVRSIGE